jgi:HPt (histidine-containing phosphotransfer) domain-containing protein
VTQRLRSGPDEGIRMSTASPIDWDVARQLTGGDEALLTDLIAMFPGESQKQLDEMRAGLAQSDAKRLERGAHTLKSSARLFGATALANISLQLERAGREGDFAGVSARLDALERELARVVAAAQNR